jgi:hypothetical protein
MVHYNSERSVVVVVTVMLGVFVVLVVLGVVFGETEQTRINDRGKEKRVDDDDTFSFQVRINVTFPGIPFPSEAIMVLGNWSVGVGDYLDHSRMHSINLATGVFTAPFHGDYAVSVMVDFSMPAGLSISPQLVLYLNSVVLVDDYYFGLPVEPSNTAYAYTQPFSRNIRLKKDDNLSITAINGDSTDGHILAGDFGITLIRKVE